MGGTVCFLGNESEVGAQERVQLLGLTGAELRSCNNAQRVYNFDSSSQAAMVDLIKKNVN